MFSHSHFPSLNQLLKTIFEEISQLSENKIVNQSLAQPIAGSLSNAVIVSRSMSQLVHDETIDIRRNYWPVMMMSILVSSATMDLPILLDCFFSVSIAVCLKHQSFPISLTCQRITNIGNMFLTKSEFDRAKLIDNINKIKSDAYSLSISMNNYSSINYYTQNALIQALLVESNYTNKQAFDCISISGIVLLYLIRANHGDINNVERFVKIEGCLLLGHSFIVINREPTTDPKNMTTWNDNTYIICPWYKQCCKLSEIKDKSAFLRQFPLLDPSDKEVTRIDWSKEYNHYLNFIKDMQQKISLNDDSSYEMRLHFV